MNEHPRTAPEPPTELDAARRDVARAEARLSSRWRAAKAAGEQSVGRALSVARPLLIGAVVVGGVTWVVTALVRGRRRGPRRSSGPVESSILKEMARAAALALASAAARRVAEHYIALPGQTAASGTAPKRPSEATW